MVRTLTLENFRNFENLSLGFQSDSVLLCGANGQGKTSVLEALFYLSTLRSFRTGKIHELIRIGSDHFHISSDISFGSWSKKYEIFLGEQRRLLIDSSVMNKASEFAGMFNLITFLPDDPEIVNGRSAVRRKFIDMFISMMDRDYFRSLQQYALAVRSRNMLLRQHTKDDLLLKAYHPVLARHGSEIIKKRMFHLRILSDFMAGILNEIRPELSEFKLKLHCVKEAADEEIFLQKLDSSIERDRMKGYTSFGPHLDDFDFMSDSKQLRLYGSRGQCRIVSFALKLAEFEIVRNHSASSDNTVVMVDDATGDLDPKAEDAFYSKIKDANQVFFTFAGPPDAELAARSQVIHISAGKAY